MDLFGNLKKAFQTSFPHMDMYSKSPTYEPSSCKLSKIQTCVRMSNHVSQFTCLAYLVTCVHPLQVVVFLCTLLYSTVQSTVVQCLYFKPRMSRSKRKSSGDVAGTTVLFKVLYCKIKNAFFIFCVCCLCIICVKSIINLLQYSIIQLIVFVGYLG